ncbi:hypothetical protein B4N89_27275 [Embleya scabrispora]|uniref:Uncharacterized protein n=1 Tax=Embleya scabrispora TaxID=159449 RepID=A0A1T3P4Z0_9ACTN|nr:hypothetical protein B4N89_27275 [Embleya scabrispora]
MTHATPNTGRGPTPAIDHRLADDYTAIRAITADDERRTGRALVTAALASSGPGRSRRDLDPDTRAAIVDVLQMVGLMRCPEIENRGVHGTTRRFDAGCLCARCTEAGAARDARAATREGVLP